MNTHLRARPGFTLLEMTLAMIIGAILSLGMWRLAQTAGLKQLQTLRQTDLATNILNADYAFHQVLDGAGGDIMSAPNFAAISAATVDAGGVPQDTLFVVRSAGPAYANATRPCRSGLSTCIVLAGNRSTGFAAGDLVLTGSPAIGARIYQLTADPQTFDAPCGADCGEAVTCSATLDDPSSPGGVTNEITGASINGGALQSTETCGDRQPYGPGGTCSEQGNASTFRRYVPYCNAITTPATLTFTELNVADRTATLAYPLGPINIGQSAGSATPKLRTQRITATRLWVQNAGTNQGALMRQSEMLASGAWGTSVPIAASVTSLQVETRHRPDGTTWTRGPGVTDAMLALGSSNRIETSTPTAGATPGYAYLKAYYTIGATRIRYTVQRRRPDGSYEDLRRWIVSGTNGTLDGGVGPDN